MSECPACRDELVEMDANGGTRLELCRSCKGILLDAEALQGLAGGDLDSLTEPSAAALTLGACLRCNTESWQPRALPEVSRAGLYACGVCRMVWLLPGELERLRERGLEERRRARDQARRGRAPSSRAPASRAPSSLAPHEPAGSGAPAEASRAGEMPPGATDAQVLASAPGWVPPPRPAELERFDRVSFESGMANWIAAPIALVLALLFCSTGLGRFFGSLVGMPFHELGHALASWLSARFAVPLPFFTVWHEEQSVPFGLVVAALIAAFGVRSWLEDRRLGVVLSLGLLALQLVMSWLVPPHHTLMLQILCGALGEIVIAALVLVAFHFPLPDALRWDFWRWPALVPASVCLAQALLLWSRAARDVAAMPWGSAIGDDSDGDMNRLCNVFGWRATELAAFYLKAALLSVLVLVATQAWAWHRARSTRAASPPA